MVNRVSASIITILRRHVSNRRRVPLSAFGALVLMVSGSVISDANYHTQHTRSYLVQTRDPSCMQVIMHTDPYLNGGWVRWGYSPDDLTHMSIAYPEHQNIVDDEHPDRRAEDFTRWDAWICAEPGQRIFYSMFVSSYRNLEDENAELVSEGDFTLPLPAQAKHVTFFGYGDTEECGADFANVSAALLNDISSDPPNTKTLLLHAGDVVSNGGQSHAYYGDNAWVDDYFSGWGAATDILTDVPVVLSLGDHDFSSEGQGKYPKYFYVNFPHLTYDDSIGMVPHLDDDGRLVGATNHPINDAYFSFDYGPVHFSVLNSYHSGELGKLGSCVIGSGLTPGNRQHNWLRSDLRRTDKPWKVLVIHVASVSCDCGPDDGRPGARQAIQDLAQHHGVDLVIAGNDHYYTRNDHGGVEHVVLGGGGAALDPSCDDGDPCRGCFFHYGRFHVIDDGTLQLDIIEVDGEKTSLYESVSLSKDTTPAAAASFWASSTELDYRTPVRLACTTPGGHHEAPTGPKASHRWDMGDGTKTSEENPLHTFPRPTNPSGIQTRTVSLRVFDGTSWRQAKKKITVYAGGSLELTVGDHIGIDTLYALFLTEPGQAFDETRDLYGIRSGQDVVSVPRMLPGDWKLTIRALGFEEWSDDLTITPDETTLYSSMHPAERAPESTTVLIDSAPTGAEVTVTLKGETFTKPAPFVAALCCSEIDTLPESCTYHYKVEHEGFEYEGFGDLETTGTGTQGAGCSAVSDGKVSQVFIDARTPQQRPKNQKASPVVILSQPSDQRVTKNGSARLHIGARSQGELKHRWFEGRSGDVSHPIHGASGAEFLTPPVETNRRYWVRVVGPGGATVDSHAARVSIVPNGPILTAPFPENFNPGQMVSLSGRGFDRKQVDHTHVYFDDFKAVVTDVQTDRIYVEVPPGVGGRKLLDLHVKTRGIWTQAKRITADGTIFVDGFESGDESAWSKVKP